MSHQIFKIKCFSVSDVVVMKHLFVWRVVNEYFFDKFSKHIFNLNFHPNGSSDNVSKCSFFITCKWQLGGTMPMVSTSCKICGLTVKALSQKLQFKLVTVRYGGNM